MPSQGAIWNCEMKGLRSNLDRSIFDDITELKKIYHSKWIAMTDDKKS